MVNPPKDLSNAIGYEEALEIARDQLERLNTIGDDWQSGPPFLRESLVHLFRDELPDEIKWTTVAEIELQNARAQGSPHSFDNTCFLTAELIKNGMPLSPTLAEFASDILLGQTGWVDENVRRRAKRPRQHGPAPQVNEVRNMLIVWAIMAIRNKGVKAERSKATKNEPKYCAIDVVIVALKEKGVHLSYEGVETVWRAYQKEKRIIADLKEYN